MNKNIAQLEDDYGVSPDSLVEAAGSMLPPVETTDKDKFLHTNAETGEKEWVAVPKEVPPVGENDKNKYLHTDQFTGDLEWITGPYVRLSVDDSNLVTYDKTSVTCAQNDFIYYTGNEETGITYYRTLYRKCDSTNASVDIIIKNELSGDLYRCTTWWTNTTFAPYTPSP